MKKILFLLIFVAACGAEPFCEYCHYYCSTYTITTTPDSTYMDKGKEIIIEPPTTRDELFRIVADSSSIVYNREIGIRIEKNFVCYQ